eukprot:CAMPEP_0202723912 /NCGR_PEP_ID=MMETSP1385-20130828/169369_1 /ASSEMBLY_ACC=CAM_ASM_000861 /TAXON_ID=933848 /ORGANISM="Elphidium margaritaceum" /LENGTH=161 /DNA_ID=CAMNT_0049389301 /DNA_START=1 /DNA_END=482 /DNA_ORIENTATION=+
MLYFAHFPATNELQNIIVAAKSKKIYIGSYSSDIFVIDIETRTSEISSFPAGNAPSFLEVNPLDASTVYVLNELGQDEYGLIFEMAMNIDHDQKKGDIQSMLTLPGYNPSSLHSSPNNDHLAVTHFFNGGGLALYSLNPLKLTSFYKFELTQLDHSQLHAV